MSRYLVVLLFLLTVAPAIAQDKAAPSLLLPYGYGTATKRSFPETLKKNIETISKSIGRLEIVATKDFEFKAGEDTVNAKSGEAFSQGTAFVVEPGDALITAAHCTELWQKHRDSTRLLYTPFGSKVGVEIEKVRAEALIGDSIYLSLPKRRENFLSLSKAEAEVGTAVMHVGFPRDKGPTAAFGYVADKQAVAFGSQLVSTAPSTFGFSGSPVMALTKDGKLAGVVGLVSAMATKGIHEDDPTVTHRELNELAAFDRRLADLLYTPKIGTRIGLRMTEKGYRSLYLEQLMKSLPQSQQKALDNFQTFRTGERAEANLKSVKTSLQEYVGVTNWVRQQKEWNDEIRTEAQAKVKEANSRVQTAVATRVMSRGPQFHQPTLTGSQIIEMFAGTTREEVLALLDLQVRIWQEVIVLRQTRLTDDLAKYARLSRAEEVAALIGSVERNPRLLDTTEYLNHFLVFPTAIESITSLPPEER